MSIENAIMQLADALHKAAGGLHALAAAQSGGNYNPTVTMPHGGGAGGYVISDGPAPPTVEATPVKAEKPKAEKPKAEKAATPAAEAPAGAKVSYADFIQKPALDLVKAKGREALAGVLKQVGATSAKEVPEARWPELRALIEAASSEEMA